MEKEFVKYEQALALKELGFDEPCFGYYDTIAVTYLTYPSAINKNSDIENSLSISKQDKNVRCSAPLYQQAFRWFREKHTLFHNIWNYTHGEPTDLIPNGFTFSIDEDWITIIGKNELGYFKKYYKTYEEAESACLDKLIEICKNNYCHYSGLPSTSSYDQ